MPGVETGILAAFAAPEKFAGPSDEPAGSPSGEGDFDRAMQAALAPPRQRTGARSSSTAARHSPAAGKTSPDTTPEKAANAKDSQTLPPADKSKTTASKGKDAPATNGDVSPDLNGSPVLVESAESSTIVLPLSLFFGSAETAPPPEKLNAVEKYAAPGTIEALGAPADASSQAGTSPVRVASGTGWRSLTTTTGAETSLVYTALETGARAALTTGGALPAANQAVPSPAAGNGEGKTVSTLPADATTFLADEKTISPDEKADPADAKMFLTAPNVFPTDAKPGEEKADLNRHLAVGQAVEDTGTGVATSVIQMKNPQNANKVAGLEVKDLPVGASQEAQEKILPAPLLATPIRGAENRDTDLNFSFSSGDNQTPTAEKSPLLNVVDLPSLADARMRAMERAHDMMALHAMRLVESKSDALSVVIKPSVGTELSLELRQRDDGVEAQATLTRGDHEFLSQHWPELQQRLEQRGIKLAPLGGEADLSANGNGNFQRQQASQEEAAQQAAAFAEFATAGNFGGATARTAVAHDGWESWA
jgi:hypothetical protein